MLAVNFSSSLPPLGLVNPLDCPHHMRRDDVCQFREGVVIDKPEKQKSRNEKGSFVDCGLKKVKYYLAIPYDNTYHLLMFW